MVYHVLQGLPAPGGLKSTSASMVGIAIWLDLGYRDKKCSIGIIERSGG